MTQPALAAQCPVAGRILVVVQGLQQGHLHPRVHADEPAPQQRRHGGRDHGNQYQQLVGRQNTGRQGCQQQEDHQQREDRDHFGDHPTHSLRVTAGHFRLHAHLRQQHRQRLELAIGGDQERQRQQQRRAPDQRFLPARVADPVLQVSGHALGKDTHPRRRSRSPAPD